jgi:choline dehydrogenase-like flavoprotein
MEQKNSPRVVVVGSGFGGLVAAQTLARYPVKVTLVDRQNFHTFQPLLYQVATAGLSPGEIAAPIRWILRNRRNVEVLMAEVQDFDLARKVVKLADGELAYDYLIVAAGASHAYFGHDEWEPLSSAAVQGKWSWRVHSLRLRAGRWPMGFALSIRERPGSYCWKADHGCCRLIPKIFRGVQKSNCGGWESRYRRPRW